MKKNHDDITKLVASGMLAAAGLGLCLGGDIEGGAGWLAAAWLLWHCRFE
jgi:hypothetical protein